MKPIKVARERSPESQLRVLRAWLEANVHTWKKEPEVVTPKDVAAVAQKIDAAEKSTVTPPPVEESPEKTPGESPWRPLTGIDKPYAKTFVTDGHSYRCVVCQATFSRTQGLWKHHENHVDPDKVRRDAKVAKDAFMASYLKAKEAEASTALDKDPEGQTIAVEDATPEETEAGAFRFETTIIPVQEEQDLLVFHALSVLASQYGYGVTPKGTAEMFADQERQIEELTTTNQALDMETRRIRGLYNDLEEKHQRVAQERDDAMTRLTMLQEQVNNMLQAFQA